MTTRSEATLAARPLDRNVMRRMALPTYDEHGAQESVGIGDTISACVRRPGGRQMYWHAARIISFDGDRALVELTKHPGERALLGPRSIRVRDTTHNGEVRGASVTAQPACEASSAEGATSTVVLGGE